MICHSCLWRRGGSRPGRGSRRATGRRGEVDAGFKPVFFEGDGGEYEMAEELHFGGYSGLVGSWCFEDGFAPRWYSGKGKSNL